MVDLVPVLLFVLGLVFVAKPQWVASIDRRQRAAGTTRHHSEIEMSETYFAVVRLSGVVLALFGLVFIIRSW